MQAITIIGHAAFTYAESKNWAVKCYTGANESDSYECGRYSNDLDKYGKEITVGKTLTKFIIYNEQKMAMRFFWIGLFTTESDCSVTGQ